MMFCKNCGKQIPDGAMFCAECGAKVEVQPAQPVNKTQEFIENRQAANTAPVPSAPPPTQTPVAKQGYIPAQPAPVKKEKDSRTAIIIVLAIIAVILVAILTVMIIARTGKPKYPDIPSFSQTTEKKEKTTKETASEATTETTTEATTQKQYGENIGKPSMSDFGWYGGLSTQSSVPGGATRLKDSDALEGKWKAYSEYNTTDVKELNVVEIKNIQEGVVKVIVSPYQTNYDGKWHDSDGKDCDYNGSIGDGTVGATSKYGTISFYDFYEKDGKQYGYGAYVNQSGETAYIALVR